MPTAEEQFASVRDQLASSFAEVGLSAGMLKIAAGQGRALEAGISAMLDEMTPEEFQGEWQWARMLVPLQLRLIVEQVLWNRGRPWKDLITGFLPMKKIKRQRALKSERSSRRMAPSSNYRPRMGQRRVQRGQRHGRR